jgi:hypothetical protein
VNVRRNAVGLFSIVCTLLAPPAQAQPNEAAATAHRLMIRSGLSVQLRGFTDQVVGEFTRNDAKLDATLVTALVDAAKDAFRPERLQEDMTARIAKKLTAGDMKAALTWLETDVGQRVTRAEERASTSFDEKSLRAYAEGLKTAPLPAKRQKLISEVISATHAVRAAAAMQEMMAIGVALGMDSLQPSERRQGEARLRARIREVMPPEKVQAALAQQLPISYAWTYRAVSDLGRAVYADFLKSVAGKRYQDGMNAAFMEGLGRASLQVGELVGQRKRQGQSQTAL